MGGAPAAGGAGGAPQGNLQGGGMDDLKKTMDESNAEATARSKLNIEDQQTKERIQGVNTAAKSGHDANAEINRNFK